MSSEFSHPQSSSPKVNHLETPPAPASTNSDHASEIVCPASSWFFKRRGLLVLMFLIMGGWFMYDGKIGYHQINEKFDRYEKIEEAQLAYDDLEDKTTWPDIAKEKGYELDSEGKPISWTAYTAARGESNEKPKRKSDDTIQEQIYWSYGMFVLAALALLELILRGTAKLRADAVSFTSPFGKRVLFTDVYKIDTRKWAKQGLAYAWSKDAQGKERKSTIDDLIYVGAQKVLDRLMSQFSGELIEKVIPASPQATSDATPESDENPQSGNPEVASSELDKNGEK